MFPYLDVDDKQNTGMGLYAMSSLMNHSCVPSARSFAIGDAKVVRAARDMKKGEEVTISYISAESNSYAERQLRLRRSWGFDCGCALCMTEAKDGEAARKKRVELSETMETIFQSSKDTPSKPAITQMEAKAKACWNEMKATYTANRSSGEYFDGLKPELARAAESFASVVERGDNTKSDWNSTLQRAIQLRMDAVELRGLRVVDRSVSGAINSAYQGNEQRLPVVLTHISPYQETCIVGIINIVKLFEGIGDRERAQRWFDVLLECKSNEPESSATLAY